MALNRDSVNIFTAYEILLIFLKSERVNKRLKRNRHMKETHKIEPNLHTFKCESCPKKFMTEKRLKRHDSDTRVERVYESKLSSWTREELECKKERKTN